MSSQSDSGLVILADRTPYYNGGTHPLVGVATWSNTTPPSGYTINECVSQNHTSGEMLNCLYQDLHVGDSTGRADNGISHDAIYTSAIGTAETSQSGDSSSIGNHTKPKDSFLVGPYKLP